ncbi:hypothetical protein BDR07DRAFT_1409337 [Suillus spraguei]|nr:hypothetical protein BDR07DRAFT_1409337 [Suillus spraguei]
MSAVSLPIMDVGHLFTAIKKHPILTHIAYVDFASFIQCASLLKDDILQPQPQRVPVSHAPDVLPDSVTKFLAASLNMTSNAVDNLWYIVKDLVWELPMSAEASAEDEVAFRLHGHKIGLGTMHQQTTGCLCRIVQSCTILYRLTEPTAKSPLCSPRMCSSDM